MLLGLILEENIFCETNFGPFNLHIVFFHCYKL